MSVKSRLVSAARTLMVLGVTYVASSVASPLFAQATATVQVSANVVEPTRPTAITAVVGSHVSHLIATRQMIDTKRAEELVKAARTRTSEGPVDQTRTVVLTVEYGAN